MTFAASFPFSTGSGAGTQAQFGFDILTSLPFPFRFPARKKRFEARRQSFLGFRLSSRSKTFLSFSFRSHLQARGRNRIRWRSDLLVCTFRLSDPPSPFFLTRKDTARYQKPRNYRRSVAATAPLGFHLSLPRRFPATGKRYCRR